MHIDMNLNHLHTLRPSGAIPGLSVIGPDSELPAHKSLRRVLRLLHAELDDGRIGALVYGWRPPGTGDDWVESRTLARLDWALGGPNTAGGIVDVYAIHSPSSEIATDADVLGLLSLAMRVERFIPPESVRIA